MSKFGNFFETLKKNKFYVWLLIFIIVINLSANYITPSEKNLTLQPKKIQNIEQHFPSAKKIKQMLLKQDNIYARMLLIFVLVFFLSIVVGVILDIFFIVFKNNRVEPIKEYPPPYKANWKLIDVIRVIILFVFVSYMIGFGYEFLRSLFKLGKLDVVSRMIFSNTLSYIIIITLLVYFIIYKYKGKFMALGLSFRNFFKDIFLGAASYVAIIPVLALAVFIIAGVSSYFKYSPKPQPLLDALFIEKNHLLLIYLIIIICFIGPLVEEIFFRGFVYRALKDSFGTLAAILISATFFAWLHMTFIGFFPILLLGILLAYLYEKSGTLVASITVHIIHNSAIVLFLYLLKGLIS